MFKWELDVDAELVAYLAFTASVFAVEFGDCLGFESSALAVAKHFQDLLSVLVIDRQDEALTSEITSLGMRVFMADIIMKTAEDRLRLAEEILDFVSG